MRQRRRRGPADVKRMREAVTAMETAIRRMDRWRTVGGAVTGTLAGSVRELRRQTTEPVEIDLDKVFSDG